ncbi:MULTISPECIES: hypothetical protein [unclassified Streptomyces]|uniref:hypothetical protein n=1 Tax=unclassified Streptomyces TaxID=2593676 RepID=UPI000747161B|nr:MULTISPECIES: hypothetical protein [unclassified Streptomyces]KUL79492.1 hypothetical protein ADL34_04410 [Streptomyces sp. NRRL WC-3605]KUL79621.1 hypothetical protein ADL33_03855 [Streptomyces sp. NRRL WC-3604]
MGSLRVTLSALAALGAVSAVPAAHAADGGVSVGPSTAAPGDDVALRVSGCPGRTATATSPAFVADAALTVGEDGALGGESRVRSTAKDGGYDVRVRCGDTTRTGSVTVARRAAGPAGAQRHGAPPSPAASPTAPVRAGGGGATRLAMVDAREAGPGTAHTVTGLVLAGVAATAVALRSARRSRRPR